MESRTARWLIRFGSVVALLFLYIPLVVVVIYAFNDSVAQVWPPKGFTTKWFSLAFGDANMRAAFLTSIKVASITTLIALGLGHEPAKLLVVVTVYQVSQ